jgi:hypothetical protein
LTRIAGITSKKWPALLPIFRKNLRRFITDAPLQNVVDKELGYCEFDTVASRINSTITRHEASGAVVRRVSWRVYSAHEIKAILEDFGLQFLNGYADLERTPVSLNTRLDEAHIPTSEMLTLVQAGRA